MDKLIHLSDKEDPKMRIWKKRITGFLIAMCAFCITAGVGTTQNVQAATKATYTIKKIQEKKTYKSSSATYSYELHS